MYSYLQEEQEGKSKELHAGQPYFRPEEHDEDNSPDRYDLEQPDMDIQMGSHTQSPVGEVIISSNAVCCHFGKAFSTLFTIN